MKKFTADKFAAYCKQVGITYDTQSVENFTLTPPKALALQETIQESADFLKLISIVPTIEIAGQMYELDIGSTIASRTNTADSPRVGQVDGARDGRTYECKKTNFDISIKYDQLDAMTIFPDFNKRLQLAVNRRIALDRLLIGWHGKSCAAVSNRTANPLLQDLNVGWFEDLRVNNAPQYIGEATIGPESDAIYKNLDHVWEN